MFAVGLRLFPELYILVKYLKHVLMFIVAKYLKRLRCKALCFGTETVQGPVFNQLCHLGQLLSDRHLSIVQKLFGFKLIFRHLCG